MKQFPAEVLERYVSVQMYIYVCLYACTCMLIIIGLIAFGPCLAFHRLRYGKMFSWCGHARLFRRACGQGYTVCASYNCAICHF